MVTHTVQHDWKATRDFWEFYMEQYGEMADIPARPQHKRRLQNDPQSTSSLIFVYASNRNEISNPEVAHLLVPCNLETAHYVVQFQDWHTIPDSECNLEIAKIPRLHGTYLLACWDSFIYWRPWVVILKLFGDCNQWYWSSCTLSSLCMGLLTKDGSYLASGSWQGKLEVGVSSSWPLTFNLWDTYPWSLHAIA